MDNRNKEQDILRAAEREFIKKGYAGTKTVAIAEQAGVTHAMLHYYFRTKEKLFNRVFEEKLGLMGKAMIDAFMQPQLSLLERVKKGMETHFDFLVENPDLPRFIINEIAINPQYQNIHMGMIRVVKTAMNGMQEELDELVKQGIVVKINVVDLLLDIISLNTFIFIAFPVIEPFVVGNYITKEEFWEHRKQENIEIMKRRLKNGTL